MCKDFKVMMIYWDHLDQTVTVKTQKEAYLVRDSKADYFFSDILPKLLKHFTVYYLHQAFNGSPFAKKLTQAVHTNGIIQYLIPPYDAKINRADQLAYIVDNIDLKKDWIVPSQVMLLESESGFFFWLEQAGNRIGDGFIKRVVKLEHLVNYFREFDHLYYAHVPSEYHPSLVEHHFGLYGYLKALQWGHNTATLHILEYPVKVNSLLGMQVAQKLQRYLPYEKE